ncbi:hypothetical protein ES703_83111 [subsurface metagenome]
MAKLSESKWLPVVVAAVAGIAIMLLMGLILGATLEEDITIDEALGIVIGVAVASYFVTGFIAGIWTRETKPGIYAALVVLAANIIYNIVGGSGLTFFSFLIAVIFAVGIGALGGWIGTLIRR